MLDLYDLNSSRIIHSLGDVRNFRRVDGGGGGRSRWWRRGVSGMTGGEHAGWRAYRV